MSAANGNNPAPRSSSHPSKLSSSTPTYSLPPHPSTTNTQRQQSPASHAAASTLAALASSPPATHTSPARPSYNPTSAFSPSCSSPSVSSSSSSSPSSSSFNVRPNTASMLNQSLYSTASSAASKNATSQAGKSPSGSPLKKEVDMNPKSAANPSTLNKPASSSAATSASATAAFTPKESGKRKKANRACLHCQKAHLTCDDSRPCQRCVKKGLADSCMDGHRKKAKYLLDDDELEELKRQKETKKAAKQAAQHKNDSSTSSQQKQPLEQHQHQHQHQQQELATIQPALHTAPSPEKVSAVNNILDQVNSNGGIPTPSSSGHGPSPHQHNYLSSNTFDTPTGAHVAPSGGSNNNNNNNNNMGGTTFELSFDPSTHNFGSEATSLEYSILSSMLNGTDLQLLGASSASPDFQTSPAVDVMDGWNIASGGGLDALLSMGMQQQHQHQHQQLLASGAGGMDTVAATYNDTAGMGDGFAVQVETAPTTRGLQELGDAGGHEASFNALEVPSPKPTNMLEESSLLSSNNDAQGGSEGNVDLGSTWQRSTCNEPVADINKAIASRRVARQQQDTIWRARIAKTYRDNTAPFPYPEGYHFLIKYVTSEFEKQDVLRIVRALAIFRPSLIALQMALTEEDEVFVERSFQRTMLEFEKLISFSGTPTVVWRRTCEICVVGAEFCMLTQWSKDELMGRRIYEIMDKGSTLDYWEKFALHAFENTTQSVMTTCTLVKPNGKLVPCAWSFTIKRDIFDLPSLVVGNFLPILS
ncbi:related to transcriptional regulator rds2 [Melanopsichium pennsylvanicum]|uniref:Transcription activator of gluconeogenesis ERT1 n=1 Tax=Melanopsichium pennsylvanicum TaxID=63383 RepID=A0AAJ5C3S3_9BASI|nr:related to transcriptional regulator rds2 [Melanopsichium pennsylvanicum]